MRLFEFKSRAVTLKQFPVGVLQLKMHEWCPKDEGTEHIAVLPGQSFRAWVGLDDSKFSHEQVMRLCGELGTLVFSVNGEPFNVDL